MHGTLPQLSSKSMGGGGFDGLSEHGKSSICIVGTKTVTHWEQKILLRVHTCHNIMPVTHHVGVRIAGWFTRGGVKLQIGPWMRLPVRVQCFIYS